jgi:hypothetical protein
LILHSVDDGNVGVVYLVQLSHKQKFWKIINIISLIFMYKLSQTIAAHNGIVRSLSLHGDCLLTGC